MQPSSGLLSELGTRRSRHSLLVPASLQEDGADALRSALLPCPLSVEDRQYRRQVAVPPTTLLAVFKSCGTVLNWLCINRPLPAAKPAPPTAAPTPPAPTVCRPLQLRRPLEHRQSQVAGLQECQ